MKALTSCDVDVVDGIWRVCGGCETRRRAGATSHANCPRWLSVEALCINECHYRITQHPFWILWSPLSRLCLVAASKTSSTPSPVSEEHSRYFFAPMRLRTSSPSSAVRNFSERLRISSCATGSSRRSFLRPTRMIGTPGQRSRTSGCLRTIVSNWPEFKYSVQTPYHLVVMFCRESGLETEKAMRITCAWL